MTESVFDHVNRQRDSALDSDVQVLPREYSLVPVSEQASLWSSCLNNFKRFRFQLIGCVWFFAVFASYLVGAYTGPPLHVASAKSNPIQDASFPDGATSIDHLDPDSHSSLIADFADYYRAYINSKSTKGVERSSLSRGELKSLAKRVAIDEGVDPDLFSRLVRWESNFDVNAVSPKGAMGLTQLMPGTADELGLSSEEYFDPEANLRGGARYLKGLIDRTGDLRVALGAYNAGFARVSGRPFQNWPRETRKYVPRVLGESAIVPTNTNPGAFVGGITSISFSPKNPSPATENEHADGNSTEDDLHESTHKETDDA